MPDLDQIPLDHYLLGLVLYREALGQPRQGRVAVAWVVRTRFERPCWWGRSLYEVITKHAQFTSMTMKGDPMTVRWPALENPSFTECIEIAEGVLSGRLPNPAPGATHYCTEWIANSTPWVKGMDVVAQIGNHIFYKLGSGPERSTKVA